MSETGVPLQQPIESPAAPVAAPPIIVLKNSVSKALQQACSDGVKLDEAIGILMVCAMQIFYDSRPPRE